MATEPSQIRVGEQQSAQQNEKSYTTEPCLKIYDVIIIEQSRQIH